MSHPVFPCLFQALLVEPLDLFPAVFGVQPRLSDHGQFGGWLAPLIAKTLPTSFTVLFFYKQALHSPWQLSCLTPYWGWGWFALNMGLINPCLDCLNASLSMNGVNWYCQTAEDSRKIKQNVTNKYFRPSNCISIYNKIPDLDLCNTPIDVPNKLVFLRWSLMKLKPAWLWALNLPLPTSWERGLQMCATVSVSVLYEGLSSQRFACQVCIPSPKPQ